MEKLKNLRNETLLYNHDEVGGVDGQIESTIKEDDVYYFQDGRLIQRDQVIMLNRRANRDMPPEIYTNSSSSKINSQDNIILIE